jgi:hypothetical protein
MKSLTNLALILFAVVGCHDNAFSKDWRGIVPLHSTVTDVERKLGAPAKRSDSSLYYNLSDEIAVITIQTESCDSFGGKFGFGWNVPAGTVAEIGVIPKSMLKKERLVVGSDFKSQDANAGFFYFTNEKDGIDVETFNGNVTLITYYPPAGEARLKCPRVQECCVDFFPKFDEYGRLPFSDEKARLDNFLIQMRERVGRGALVVLGENASARTKLIQHAQRAKRYLVQTRGMEPHRLLIIDGGYREEPVTELHLYPIGGEVNRISLFPEKDRR